uniref:Uncharacterized protein n=1 Tax=Acrobeloides nanus TaxID=290746 RepID=A0A914C957_9BILA
MKAVSTLVTEKTREAQRQLSHILLFQTISPIILIFIPFMFLVIPTIAKLETTVLSTAAVTFMPWVPAINSLSIMYIIKSYRNAIKRTFLRGRQVEPTSTQTAKSNSYKIANSTV